jgi:Sigma-70, region 4
MKLQTPKVFAKERSREGEDDEGFQNSITSLRPLLPAAEVFCDGARTPRRDRQSVIRHHASNRRATVDMTAFVSRCFPRTIAIPARLQGRPLEALSGSSRISVRLAHVLHRSGVRVLGDLQGRRVGDFAWVRNCGFKTLQELDSLASTFANQHSSRNRRTTASEKAGPCGTAFAIPKSVCRLRFDELPITKRLANVARSSGLRTLGDLRRRTPFELLQYKACGWCTLAELEQLIEHAISGEFDVARIDASRAVAELLTLLEQGIAKLGPRDRQFLLARICGMTFAEIGRPYGFTRARAHQSVARALDTLRKSYGPRIPRLLRHDEDVLLLDFEWFATDSGVARAMDRPFF